MFMKNHRLVEAQRHFLPLSAQFAHMWFVGLLGGAMYVNTFYSVMADHNIASEDKEMCVNLLSLFVNVGIISSALFDLLAAATFLK
jgi:hypothetical protein